MGERALRDALAGGRLAVDPDLLMLAYRTLARRSGRALGPGAAPEVRAVWVAAQAGALFAFARSLLDECESLSAEALAQAFADGRGFGQGFALFLADAQRAALLRAAGRTN